MGHTLEKLATHDVLKTTHDVLKTTHLTKTAPILHSFYRNVPSKNAGNVPFEENFSDLRARGHTFRWKGLANDVLFIVLSTTYCDIVRTIDIL